MNRDGIKNFVAEVRRILIVERPVTVWLQTHDLGKCVTAPESTSDGIVNEVIIRSIFVNASTNFAHNRAIIAKDLGCSSIV